MHKITRLPLAFILMTMAVSARSDMNTDIETIQHNWATAKYAADGDGQVRAFDDLIHQARLLVDTYPDKAEPKVWLAISLSTYAGINGGLGALGMVKEARSLLESAENIDPDVLEGSVYTSLGSLYYQVPPWPIAFGNDEKAEQYLKKALVINPNGIDPNYFYGDFLYEQGRYDQAISYLNKASQALPRAGRPLADSGRRGEIAEKLEAAKSKL